MTRFELIQAYVLQATGQALQTFSPVPLSATTVLQTLWPMHERFRPALYQIRSVAYSPTFEVEANEAIEALLLQGDDWADLSPGAWRVLLERHQQLLLVALMLERQGKPMSQVPDGVGEAVQSAVAIADLLHSMKLPLPPEDRSAFELPAGAHVESTLRQH